MNRVDKAIDPSCNALRRQDTLIEHKHYIDKNGQDLPEIRNWKWGLVKEATRAGKQPPRRG